MKCTTPEISWHNRDPVLSVDIQNGLCENSKGETFWRVATGGADCHVLIWHLTTNGILSGAILNFAADLERHQRAVNVVRFSPSKQLLASGDDESIIILWRQNEKQESSPSKDDTENKEHWTSWKTLKGHLEDIYDISWSPDSNSLISGSVDNTAMLWDVKKGRSTAILSDHKGFVQGVSWDPCNEYVCTISTDRHCRLISVATKKVVQRVFKSTIPTPAGSPLEGKIVRLFYDDTFKSFFRRLTFSPDGTLIFVPSGIIESQETAAPISNATMVFSRQNIKEPIMVLPTQNECTIAVRCCPVYFEIREDGPDAVIPLPYRMVFAVATQNSVIIYDTQQISPICVISLIHYGRLNDLSWSSNGRILIVCSSDGYCSIIHFDKDELGKIYKTKTTPTKDAAKKDAAKETLKTFVKQQSPTSNEAKDSAIKRNVPIFAVDDCAMDIDLATSTNTDATAHNRFDERKTHGIAESEKLEIDNLQLRKSYEEETEEDIKLVYEDSDNSNIKKKATNISPKKIVPPPINQRPPRRVELITLSSPKGGKRK